MGTARRTGELSEEDMKNLTELHTKCVELAGFLFHRMKLGHDTDNHGNSWWRHYDGKIKDLSSSIAYYAKCYEPPPEQKKQEVK